MAPSKDSKVSPVIAAVIPCYREKAAVLEVIAAIGKDVSHIYVIDDACPDETGKHVTENCRDARVEVVTHTVNTGVGGATASGYARALEAGADIIVKLDGDGQMDPRLIGDLTAPIREGRADYTKGNRFYNLKGLAAMPKLRLFGNLLLSFASKLSSGYWNVFDTTNGFTAIGADAARQLPLNDIDKGYFFESDMLFHLYLLGAVVCDVPMQARYGDEQSSLRITNIVLRFTVKHLSNTFKRIAFTYFLRDFGIYSIELVLGLLLFIFGTVFGIVSWAESTQTGIPATAGTVILAALPIILGSQLLISFLNHDTRNMPSKPLNRRV